MLAILSSDIGLNAGICVCQTGFSGDQCDDARVELTLPISTIPLGAAPKFIYREFDWALASAPSDANVNTSAAAPMSASIESISARGVLFRVTNNATSKTDKAIANPSLRFSARARIVPATQSGIYAIGDTKIGPVFAAIRFPESWPAKPHVAVEVRIVAAIFFMVCGNP